MNERQLTHQQATPHNAPVTAPQAYRFLCFLLVLMVLPAPMAFANADTPNSIAKSTDSVEAAITLRKQGNVYDSIAMLERLKSTNSKDVRVNLELAVSHLKAQQFGLAQDAVADIYAVAPAMKQHPRMKRLCRMLDRSEKEAKASKHQFSGEFTSYRGFDEITSEYPYFEITEYDDYYQVERKSDKIKSKFHYFAGRLKGEYRYTPSERFDLFGHPTKAFFSNRITYFQKRTNGEDSVRFGFASLDSSFFLVQPKRWAFNAKLKGKWHRYQGKKTLTEQSLNVNGSVLFWGARLQLGVSHKKDSLNMSFADDVFGEEYYIYEQKTSITSPYAKLSYRFGHSWLWSVGARHRNINADNPLLEGKVTNYNTTLKYTGYKSFDLHLSYHQDDLHYDQVNLDLGLNSGEMKKSVTLGAAYNFNENWQFGINALYMDKALYDDFGKDQWKRLEGFVRYRF